MLKKHNYPFLKKNQQLEKNNHFSKRKKGIRESKRVGYFGHDTDAGDEYSL